MLVLTRRINESLEIGNGVTVKVISVRGQQVRLGVIAPVDVKVLRSELKRLEGGPDAGTGK